MASNGNGYSIIEADPQKHAADLHRLIKTMQELYTFEGLEDRPQVSPSALQGYMQEGRCGAFLAVHNKSTVVGYLLYYTAYSTWVGPYLFMEDLYVSPDHRRAALASALMHRIGLLAMKDNLPRIHWDVLNWNEGALKFYNRFHPIDMFETDNWLTYKLDKPQLTQLANFPCPKFRIETVDPVKHSEAIRQLIQELADYEKCPNYPKLDAKMIQNLLQTHKYTGVFVALDESDTVIGYVWYYIAYSTWQGPFMIMEDLYVREDIRQGGLGTALWQFLAKKTLEWKMSRLQWNVLGWNEPAIKFYQRFKPVDLGKEEAWITYRLNKPLIENLVKSTSEQIKANKSFMTFS